MPRFGGVLRGDNMSYDDQYRITVKVAENGFLVSVPDFEEIAKKQAAAEKNAAKNGGSPSVYLGDCTEDFVAKDVKQVLKIVQTAIEQIPEDTEDTQFDKAFEAAAK